jgi:ring-1,2-phenylacetyl-CoA epoxidase subunit PaaD
MTMPALSALRRAVATVEDPEVPVTLVDLGIVRDLRLGADGSVCVVLRPTRLACPARSEMARRVREAIHSIAPGVGVEVEWELAAWRGDDVSISGRRALLQIGYADPGAETLCCPYCGSADVRREGAYGGAVCKVPFTCRGCGSTYDALRGCRSHEARAPDA